MQMFPYLKVTYFLVNLTCKLKYLEIRVTFHVHTHNIKKQTKTIFIKFTSVNVWK